MGVRCLSLVFRCWGKKGQKRRIPADDERPRERAQVFDEGPLWFLIAAAGRPEQPEAFPAETHA